MAAQTWYEVVLHRYEKETAPNVPDPKVLDNIRNDRQLDGETKQRWLKYFGRKVAREVFVHTRDNALYLTNELVNVTVSLCYSCGAFAVWIADGIVYPTTKFAVEPADDIPGTIRPDYLEASSIVDVSPRGAAALLRLCIQKLLVELGESGKN